MTADSSYFGRHFVSRFQRNYRLQCWVPKLPRQAKQFGCVCVCVSGRRCLQCLYCFCLSFQREESRPPAASKHHDNDYHCTHLSLLLDPSQPKKRAKASFPGPVPCRPLRLKAARPVMTRCTCRRTSHVIEWLHAVKHTSTPFLGRGTLVFQDRKKQGA